MKDRIPVKLSAIPYAFDILLGDTTFQLLFKYNEAGDFYTLTLSLQGELICAGEPLVYGQPLFRDVYVKGRYPAVQLIPLDESGQTHVCNQATFGKTVFLCIDDEGA